MRLLAQDATLSGPSPIEAGEAADGGYRLTLLE